MKKQVKKIEFIESYIKKGNSDYEWTDNHGELIRCKACKYWRRLVLNDDGSGACSIHACLVTSGEWYCASAKKKDDEE